MRYIRDLAVALDLQELDDYKLWCGAHDGKDFPWSSPDHAGSKPTPVSEKVETWAKRLRWGSKVKRSAWEFANATGKQVVVKAMKWDSD
ncbi:unnamed protein product, partial [marine sediment metagenome]